MYAARDRPLPLGRLREFFPYLTTLILTFMAVFRVVSPVVEAGSAALQAIRNNDHQVLNM